MQGIQFFKKFLMPCGLCAATPAIKPVHPPQDGPAPCSNDSTSKKLIRPSELPIYSFEDDLSKHIPCKKPEPPSMLEENISKVRKSVQGVLGEFKGYSQSLTTTIDTGREHSKFLLDYLREESNVMPRIGAVGIGGLTGLILGLRGGKFKKLLYSTTGALSVGAICYPKKAQEGLVLAKHYANISYNFVYGVKPGDNTNQPELKLPEMPQLKMPSSFSEFVSLGVDAATALAGAANTLAQKVSKAVTGDEKKEDNPASKTDPKQK